jgi:L-aspartate oxidase
VPTALKTLDAARLADEIQASDVVVVGGGVAGLTTALELAPRKVTLLVKGEFAHGGSSPWAQGGVAVALATDDSPRLHALDTLAAGAGLCDDGAVTALTQEGPRRVLELARRGARFDRDAGGELLLGREAAHRRRRILHAQGDATGAEMVRALASLVRETPSIEVVDQAFAVDLVLEDDRVVGVLAERGGRRILHRAQAVVLATGGLGQLYARTTNPPENTGDGLAMAARAGAVLIDLEFVQFHPTALDVDRDPLPLISEAVRGEGAHLLNDLGERFLEGVHPLVELAPRDIVARAIWAEQQRGRRVTLDAASALGAGFAARFPSIDASCRSFGIDPSRQPIPVTPAAHYTMGGIAVDRRGRSSLDGLWACGEVACTGVHGANRLASNSLLEALVFGAKVAADITGWDPGRPLFNAQAVVRQDVARFPREGAVAEPEGVRRQLREMAWAKLGLVREREGLASALAEIEAWSALCPATGELRNLLTVATLVAASALIREESRGGHYRTDFPLSDIVWQRRLGFTYHPGRKGSPLQPAQPSELLTREIA